MRGVRNVPLFPAAKPSHNRSPKNRKNSQMVTDAPSHFFNALTPIRRSVAVAIG
jgi:hypothetical protein